LEIKVVCSAHGCLLDYCPHYTPHEKKDNCTSWSYCSAVGSKVRCTKVIYQ